MNIAVQPENINSREALAGKVSLVTGSTSGIGLGIARALAGAGSEIVLNGFGKPEAVADVEAKIAADFKVRVTFSPADMSKPAAIREGAGLRRPLADLIDGVEIAIHEQARMAPTCRYDRSFRR